MIQDELQKLLKEALKGIADVHPLIERPQEEGHGDYSSNIALVIGKQAQKNPLRLAQEISSKIRKSSFLEKVEVAGLGFLNFFLSREYLLKELGRIAREKDSYGSSKEWKGKKVMVEFTDPNPFKEFHIGHLYSNAVGESLARLYEALGAEVKRANYQGDIGLHVAKALWGMEKLMEKENITLADLARKPLQERAAFMGKAYAAGAKAYEEKENAKKEIEELNLKVFQKDKSVKELYEKGKKWSLEYFENIYKILDAQFDFYYFESNVGEEGRKLVAAGLKKGIFKKSQGAVVFEGEKEGLHSRVFVSSQGLPTYEAKELGLAPVKYRDFPYDLSIIVTGNEIIEYFKVLLAALHKLNPKLAEKTKHVSHGMVRFPEGKISSRKGEVLSALLLICQVKEKVEELVASLGSEIPQKDREKAIEAIALGAIKYSFLRVSLGKDIVFDAEKSLSLAGDSGPYLQYTYARCRSILKKAQSAGPFGSEPFRVEDWRAGKAQNETEYSLAEEESGLLRFLTKFPEVVQEAAEKFSSHLLCSFAFDLAQKYNLFYQKHPVLGAKTPAAKQLRLSLTAATAQVLKNCLQLLGIKTLERM